MGNYFCGWYFRLQSPEHTVAIIPAIHKNGGTKSCSVQLLTDSQSWNISFPYTACHRSPTELHIGKNRFGRYGLQLDLHTSQLTATGYVRFGPFSPIRYDIMGPFRFLPGMECRHSVVSMRHSVNGVVNINGIPYYFNDAVGYLEGDRGRSFPKEYAWTQAAFPGGSLMLSVADIPLLGQHFTGVICVIHFEGKEYRLATYLGAKAVKIQSGEIVVTQGNKQLTVRQLEQLGRPLQAPARGAMTRTIHEHAACRVFYQFQADHRTIFQLEVPNAAFEYEYPS